nr:hypothetical protein [Tanacetum cinerariifolium]
MERVFIPHGSRLGGNDDEAGPSRAKRSRQFETVEEVLLPQVHYELFLWGGCNREDILNRMGCDGEMDDMLRIKFRAAESNEEIFTSVAWIRAFNINKPIYSELFTSFIQLMNLMKLGLYHADELDEDRFNVYFEGVLRVVHKMITYGLCQRTTGYDKIQKHDLWLLSMFDARHQNRYANVAWLITRWMKREGAGTQKESQICCGQFITKIARKIKVLPVDVIRSLSALIYCRDLDTTTIRELIDSEGRLIPEDPQPGVLSVGIPRHPRASMKDLYDWIGRMEYVGGY